VESLLNRGRDAGTEARTAPHSSQDTRQPGIQSILSEIQHRLTTTYNDTAVFGSNTNIYTGTLDRWLVHRRSEHRTLSFSQRGDTGGAMAYSNGQNNVFLNSPGRRECRLPRHAELSGNDRHVTTGEGQRL